MRDKNESDEKKQYSVNFRFRVASKVVDRSTRRTNWRIDCRSASLTVLREGAAARVSVAAGGTKVVFRYNWPVSFVRGYSPTTPLACLGAPFLYVLTLSLGLRLVFARWGLVYMRYVHTQRSISTTLSP